MPEEIRLRSVGALLEYMTKRATDLNSVIEFYYNKARDSYMTNDDYMAYQLAVARIRELEDLLNFMEGK